MGEWRTISLKSVRATEQTEIEVLGQSGQVLEYQPEVDPATRWLQDGDKLRITYLSDAASLQQSDVAQSTRAQNHECGRSLMPRVLSQATILRSRLLHSRRLRQARQHR